MLAYTIELEQNKNQFSKNLDEKKKNASIIYQLFHIINNETLILLYGLV